MNNLDSKLNLNEYKQEQKQQQNKSGISHGLAKKDYMREFMRKKREKEKQQKENTKELLKNIANTLIKIINLNTSQIPLECQAEIKYLCLHKAPIEEIVINLNNMIKQYLM